MAAWGLGAPSTGSGAQLPRVRVRRGLVGWAGNMSMSGLKLMVFLGWAPVRVVRVPWADTRITRNNFGYRGLEPELRFGFFELGLGFFGFGFRVELDSART